MTLDEAGFESILIVSLGLGNYFNLKYMLDQIADAHEDPHMEEHLNSLININTILLSTFVSTISLTMAQVKAHDTQHEYSMSTKQKLLHVLACTTNTVSFLLTFSCFACLCMFWCCHTFFLTDVGGVPYYLGMLMTGIVCPSFSGLLRVITLFFTKRFYRKEQSLLNKNGYPFRTSRISKIFNPAEVLQLPTSSTNINSYNSVHSTTILVNFSKQFIANIIMIVVQLPQLVMNLSYYRFDISKSSEWRSFLSISLVLVPVCFYMSFFFLWLCYKLDEGYFIQSNMFFKYKKRCLKTSCNGKENLELQEDIINDASRFIQTCQEYREDLHTSAEAEVKLLCCTIRKDLMFSGNLKSIKLL
ncbi:uncharacterized protein LOC111712023 [Eurytemora carolleeae]|uniref:uncharacterized protein LOC111712023 n=1 Tax=Eurytemora carolleeae TaxID=1294199 RepID=UPI000C75E593|nr:uncharacterized protein LOC111712023 [Eurytemora carolleeae]|eukprot:XP_023342299.1 uncharacterized protein LOC111712023 [Eurytemora affinis]